VDSWGIVYELLKIQPEEDASYLELVTYASDGQYKSAVKLDITPESEVAVFLALQSGSFLVAGKEKIKGTRDKAGSFRSFAAVVAPDGRLTRRFRATAHETLAAEDKVFDDDVAQNYVEGEVGSDGNLYLLRGSLQAVIDVASESGRRIRSMSLKPPRRNAIPFDLRLDKNRLLLTYLPRHYPDRPQGQGDDAPLYVLFDSESGQPVRSYVAGQSLQGQLSCFHTDSVSFLSLRNGMLAIVKAELE
jgi:hypothetical protein